MHTAGYTRPTSPCQHLIKKEIPAMAWTHTSNTHCETNLTGILKLWSQLSDCIYIGKMIPSKIIVQFTEHKSLISISSQYFSPCSDSTTSLSLVQGQFLPSLVLHHNICTQAHKTCISQQIKREVYLNN